MDITWCVKIKGVELKCTTEITNISIGDGGIGYYEFWGATGVDSFPVVDDFTIEDIYVGDGNREISDKLKTALIESLEADNFFADAILEAIQ